jgi:hypothetical protein
MNSTDKAELQEEVEIIEGVDPDIEENDDEDEDVRLSDSRNEEEDSRREAKRLERRRRKDNQRFARDKSKEEMEWLVNQNQLLQKRLEAVEGFAIQNQRGSLDQNYTQAIYSVQATEQALAKAIEVGDGARVPELLRQRDTAMARAAEINRAKQSFDAPRAPQQPAEVTEKAQKWASQNTWFNASSTDPDSVTAKQVDAGLVAEGYDPTTQKYWRELDRRLADRLPHRFAEEEDSGYTAPQAGRRGPPVGGSREMSSPGSKKVYVSSERVQALKDAGYWDDPVLRERMLKRYAAVDRDTRAAR